MKTPHIDRTQFDTGGSLSSSDTDAMATDLGLHRSTLVDTPSPHTMMAPAGYVTQVSRMMENVPTASGFPDIEDPNSKTFGKYELLSEIARGGMGVVYRAKQQGLDRIVALKMVLGGAGEKMLHQRLLQEAKAAGSLDHPNIVPIYDSGEIDGRLFFTMAFVDGPDLKRHCDNKGSLTVVEVVRLFSQICDGLAHAHAKGIIHRDLKPANVLIDRDGRPRVTDFGLAKRTDSDTEMTKTGQVMGTPAYMPPEQARGRKDVGPSADVYALGGILYYLMTHRAPFTGETTTEILFKLANETPILPSQINPDAPADIEAICMKCLAKAPEDRYPDAVALSEAFQAVAVQHLPSSLANISGVTSQPRMRIASSPGLETTNIGVIKGPPSAIQSSADVAPPPSYGIWYLAGVAAIFACGAVIFFALNSSKKDQLVASKDIVPAAVLPAEIVAKAETAVALPSSPNWKATTKGEIPISFELLTPGKKDSDVVVIPNRSQLSFRAKSDVDCYMTIWSIDTEGNAVKLFPNQFDTDSRLVAGVARDFPGKVAYDMTASPTGGSGHENLKILVSSKPMRDLSPDEVSKGFDCFTSADGRRRLQEWTRGIEISAKKENHKVAHGELKYRVTE